LFIFKPFPVPVSGNSTFKKGVSLTGNGYKSTIF